MIQTNDDFAFLRRLFSYVLPVFFLIFLDQLTKYFAVTGLKGGSFVALIPHILYLLYTENTGVAFGLFEGHNFVFVFIALLVSVFLFVYAMKMPLDKRFLPLRVALSFITAGAIGNVIDRLRYGYVIDFIYFSPIDFPVFNFADICVTVSSLGILILFIFVYKDSDFKKLEVFKKT